MGNIVPIAERQRQVRSLLESPAMQMQIRNALPKVGITPERFARMVMTCIGKTPKLLECDRTSLFGCFIQAAESGLSPSGIGGEAYIIPYGKTATFIPGYRGLMKAAWRSERVLEMAAEVVLTDDKFSYKRGSHSHLDHEPAGALDEVEANITHTYAYAKLTGGGFQFVVMTKAAVDKIRRGSRASNNGPWVDHYAEMSKKTAIRRLMKMLPLSSDDMRLVELAAQEEGGIPQDLPVVDIPSVASDFAAPPGATDAGDAGDDVPY